MNKIRFKSLSSGSCGNCYFLGSFDDKGNCECAVLIDAGVSPRRLKKELAVDGISPEIISGILVTHDHYDHVRALGSYCKLHRKPVWTTPKLCTALMNKRLTGEYLSSCRRHLASGWNEIEQGRILAKYFTVPHDATQTVGYAIMIDGYKFVIMTDIGRMTREALDLASQADTVVIESNYDPVMLKNSPYPPELQERHHTSVQRLRIRGALLERLLVGGEEHVSIKALIPYRDARLRKIEVRAVEVGGPLRHHRGH